MPSLMSAQPDSEMPSASNASRLPARGKAFTTDALAIITRC